MSADPATAGRAEPGLTPPWQRLGLGVLTEHVPVELIDEVLATTGRVQRRVRLLPARVVVLFVLAMCLFSAEGYRGVWRQLVNGAPGLDDGFAPSRQAFTQARRRLGTAPLAELFARVRGPQGQPGMPGVFLAGLRLVAWDGTKLHVPDSPANAQTFTRPANAHAVGGFPQVRLMTLIECGTHAVIDATFGAASEQVLARRLLPALGPGMLLLADRNFFARDLWSQAAATGAHLLWRIRADHLFPPMVALSDGSYLTKPTALVGATRPSHDGWVRVVEYTITVTTGPPAARRTRTEQVRLATTLTDPAQVSADQLATAYHQRWESEISFQALKTHQRGPRRVLRSRDPDGVTQEVFAYLITYQALRRLMADTAASLGIDCDRLSFTAALRLARRHILNQAAATRARLAKALTTARWEILDQANRPRRARTSPRAVKRPVSPYPSRRATDLQRSAKTSYIITIISHPTPA